MAAEKLCELSGVQSAVFLVVREKSGPGFNAIATVRRPVDTEEEAQRFLHLINQCIEQFLAEERWCMAGYTTNVEALSTEEIVISGICTQ